MHDPELSNAVSSAGEASAFFMVVRAISDLALEARAARQAGQTERADGLELLGRSLQRALDSEVAS
jgi:hypothetical protein